MAFVANVLKELMNKGLTRKEAKEVFNSHKLPASPRVAGVSRPLQRWLVRKRRSAPFETGFTPSRKRSRAERKPTILTD